jgi:hypothetical protein
LFFSRFELNETLNAIPREEKENKKMQDIKRKDVRSSMDRPL